LTRTPENLVYHELIGLPVEVSRSTDSGRTGLRGLVVDETRNTLVIKGDRGLKVIPKAESWFIFHLDEKKVEVDGKILAYRPEDRIKKIGKKIGGIYGRM